MCFHAKTCEIMGKTVLFGVIFHQNGRVWPPGETTYVVLGCCKALCLIGNAFLCISKSVFWVFDIFQKLKIAKNSYFFVFFTKFSRSTPWWESTGIMILMQKTFSIATLTIFSEKNIGFGWYFMGKGVKKMKIA